MNLKGLFECAGWADLCEVLTGVPFWEGSAWSCWPVVEIVFLQCAITEVNVAIVTLVGQEITLKWGVSG